LDAYLDGEIRDGSESAIEEHLSVCQKCQDLRRVLKLSRLYLRKLKGSPQGDFVLNREQIFALAPIQPALVLAKAAAVLLLFVTAGVIFYFSSSLGPSLNVARKSGAIAPEKINFVNIEKGIPVLPEEKEVVLNTINPTLVKIGQESWVSIKGRASLYKDKDSLSIDLVRGELYFVSDPDFSLKKSIKAAGFQVTALNTEFFIRASEGDTEIQLFSGRLLIKYREGRNLTAVQLLSGEALNSTGAKDIKIYRLSSEEKADLARRIDRIKTSGRWFETHPKQTHFESGDIRIEYWKEG